MAQQTINIGTVADDGTGDTLRVGGDKINDNFTELYAADAALGTAAPLDVDPDDTLAADSDSLIPTQQAVKAYVDNEIAGVGGGSVSDTAYGVGWNGDTTTAPSKNAVYDKIEAVVAGGSSVSDTAYGSGWNGDTTTAPSKNAVYDKIESLSSGGAAWALAGTGQTATGVYDFAVDGAKANIDFVGLGSFNELRIVARGLSAANSGLRTLHVSVDNGSTFYTTSGDYVVVDNAGVEANVTGFTHNTATTSARSLVVHIINSKGTAKYGRRMATNEVVLFVASASDINAIRITNSAGGNITAGTVRVFAR